MKKWLIRGIAVFVGRKAWEMYQRRNSAGRGTAPGPGGPYGSGGSYGSGSTYGSGASGNVRPPTR